MYQCILVDFLCKAYSKVDFGHAKILDAIFLGQSLLLNTTIHNDIVCLNYTLFDNCCIVLCCIALVLYHVPYSVVLYCVLLYCVVLLIELGVLEGWFRCMLELGVVDGWYV